MMRTMKINRFIKVSLSALVFGLVACSTGSTLLKPADMGPNPALIEVRTTWSEKIGIIDFPLLIAVTERAITLASSEGTVISLDATTGAAFWRTNIGTPIAAGVGSDGRFAAVVTRGNEVVVLEAGRELWRTRLTSQVFTAPLVAGNRIFVLGADRGVTAFDAQSGNKLWSTQRPGEALVLRQAGILIAINNTLVAGLAGHLVGINPQNGNVVWDAAIASPRGTNDIERLVDLVAGVSRYANVVCARAFQAEVGCVNTDRGNIIWKHAASGAVGLQGDDKQIYGVEADGRMLAWRLTDGQVAWSTDRLRYHQLSAPLVLGRSVVVGDESGLIHLLSRSDGTPLTRLSTDGSAIVVTPVVAGKTLVVVTRNGGVFGLQAAIAP